MCDTARTSLLSDAPPRVSELEPKRNRRVHRCSLVRLHTPVSWTTLLTTNVSAMPFDYVDFDVKPSEKPQKFYRVRQQ